VSHPAQDLAAPGPFGFCGPLWLGGDASRQDARQRVARWHRGIMAGQAYAHSFTEYRLPQAPSASRLTLSAGPLFTLRKGGAIGLPFIRFAALALAWMAALGTLVVAYGLLLTVRGASWPLPREAVWRPWRTRLCSISSSRRTERSA
jgi:hypothetical protein